MESSRNRSPPFFPLGAYLTQLDRNSELGDYLDDKSFESFPNHESGTG